MAAYSLEMLADPLALQELYEAALQRSGSPLVALLDHIEPGKSPRENGDEKDL